MPKDSFHALLWDKSNTDQELLNGLCSIDKVVNISILIMLMPQEQLS